MSTYDLCLGTALDTWLTQLDHEEFQIGLRERLLVQTLLAQLAASGELAEHWSLEEILQLAGPLLCTQPEQQRKYAKLLGEFAARQEVGGVQTGQEEQAWHATQQKPWQFRIWYGILVALLAGAMGFGVWWLLKPQPPPSVITPDTVAGQSNLPIGSDPVRLPNPIYVPVSSLPMAVSSSTPEWASPARIGLLVLGGISLLGLSWLGWARWRRQLYLQGTRTDKEVEELLLTDPNPVKIEPPPAILRRTSRTMRQQYSGEREMLDVAATLRATMSACGALLPRYRSIKQTPEYLVLIDRRHPADHHAALSEAFVAALKRSGVDVEVRYFKGSPQTGCWRLHATPAGGLEPFRVTSFPEVAARFTGYRLIVFADARVLVDEVDGSPCRWTMHLRAFPQRAWLTPMPMASWGPTERVADAQGFLVLPVQLESLNTMAGWFSAGQLGLEVSADWPLTFPPMLRGEEVAWVVRQTAPPPEIQEDLLFQLRNYLGTNRFQWLCACAIFPAISPAITLALGRELTADVRNLALGVAAIGALPWFRHGFMPAWLRLALLDRFEEFHKSRFRQIVEERLASALESGPGSPLLTVAERKRRLSAWVRRQSGPARDVILVGFLEHGPLSRLAQKLPEGLRRRLFRHGLPVYGLTREVLWMLPVGALLGVLGLPGIWERITHGWGGPIPILEMITPPLRGHESSVYSAAFSPDGQRVVTASGDQTARVWEAATGTLVAELKGHTNWVYSAAFSPDGQRVVTASGDHTARVWEAATGTLVAELKGHTKRVFSAAFSPDGQRVVTASGDQTARVWEAATGTLVAELRGHTAPVYSAAFSPDGQRVVTASGDQTARVWEAATGTLVAELRGHTAPVYSAAFSPDGQRVVTASDDDTARVWEAATGTLVAELRGHTAPVYSAAFSPDGQRVVTASDDNTARVWEAATGTLVAELRGHTAPVYSAAFSPDGQRVVTASDDDTARVWEAATGTLVAELRGHTAPVYSAAFSPDGQRVVTASWDKTARLWGRPEPSALDLLDCSSAQGVTTSVKSLADRVAEAVKNKVLPPLAAVAYLPRAWHPPEGLSLPSYGTVLYGAGEGRPTADALAQWLTAEAGRATQMPQSSWKIDLAAQLGSKRFVVNTCTLPINKLPDRNGTGLSGEGQPGGEDSAPPDGKMPNDKTFADLQLNERPTIQADNNRIARLAQMYRGLKEMKSPEAIHVRAKLDALDWIVGGEYPFSLYEFNSPAKTEIYKDVEIVSGAHVQGKGFTKIIDFLGHALTTIETLEMYFPNAPPMPREQQNSRAELEGELQAARKAVQRIGDQLNGEPAVMEALDLVFGENSSLPDGKMPNDKTFADLQVAVFGCSVAENNAKQIIASIVPAIERLGAKPTVQFVSETQRARFAPSDVGLNIRVTKNVPKERTGAQALLAQPEFKKSGSWKQVFTRQESQNYLSVFVCPVNFSAPKRTDVTPDPNAKNQPPPKDAGQTSVPDPASNANVEETAVNNTNSPGSTFTAPPYSCSGPYKEKKLSEDDVNKILQAHEKWLTDSKDPKGQQANFCGAKLPRFNFQGADLKYAVFQMAMVAEANFTGANLNEAKLQGANLSLANFSKANLTNAHLDGANFSMANLTNAHLDGADIGHAMLYRTNLHGVDLTEVKKLAQSQIAIACLDKNTKLPDGLKRLDQSC